MRRRRFRFDDFRLEPRTPCDGDVATGPLPMEGPTPTEVLGDPPGGSPVEVIPFDPDVILDPDPLPPPPPDPADIVAVQILPAVAD